jgi:hypothetical protein
MADDGYVFVCEQGAACRVHIALHGCQQDIGTIGRLFIEKTGYNAWADANQIIVLYPQTKTSDFLPYNPDACWDWWSYIDHDEDYVTKAGLQIAAIKTMLDTLTASTTSAASAPNENQNPIELVVSDTSDTAAALAWTRIAGAASYRISRAGAEGVFSVVGETEDLSYADQGLTANTSYAWRVTAVVGGVEQSPSAITRAMTRVGPPICDAPGSCP